MAEDKLLDIVDTTKVKNLPSFRKMRNHYIPAIPALFGLLVLLSVFLTSCSSLRIVVLDDPLTPEEHIALGLSYEKRGETDNAIEEYKKASKNLPVAYLYLGNIYFQKGDLEHAKKYYRKTIKEKPDISDAYNNLAWVYYTEKENLAEAMSLVLKALELNPSNEQYRDTLNKIEELRGKNRV